MLLSNFPWHLTSVLIQHFIFWSRWIL